MLFVVIFTVKILHSVFTIILVWIPQTSFTDMYIGYTTTLATFLSLEFNRLNTEKAPKMQVGYMCTELLPRNVLFFSPHRPLKCDVIPLDGANIPVPTAFNCIETAIGKS